MKRSCVVIFAYSETEATYAVNYKRTHQNKNVKILAGSLSAQLTLLQNSENPDDYQELLYRGTTNNYNSYTKNIYQQSVNVWKYLHQHLLLNEIHGVNILEALRLQIEAEYFTVFYTANLYEKIQQLWSPKLFLFPNNLKFSITGWNPDHFSEATIMSKYFCDSSQVIYFESRKSYLKRFFFELFRKFISSPRIIFLILPLLRRVWMRIMKKKSLPKRVDFLIFSHGFHLYFYNKLLLKLGKQANLSYVIVTAPQSLEDDSLLHQLKIPFVPLVSLQTSTKFGGEQINKKNLYAIVAKLNSPKMLQKIFPSTFSITVKKTLFAKLIQVIEVYGPKFFRQTEIAHQVFNNTRPRLLITTHDPGPSVIPFVSIAKKSKIPTLVMQHGFHDIHYSSDYQSDYMACWGNYFKERYVRLLHKNKNTIFPVGFPFLDELLVQRSNIKEQYTLKNNERPRLGMLVTLYQVDPFVIPKFFIELFLALNSAGLTYIEVWIRVHSGQTLEHITELARLYNIRCIYNPSVDIVEFIKKCDIIYSWDTTAILWALIYKKPLFYSSPWGGEGFIPIKQFNVGWVPRNAADFVNYLKEYLQHPEKSKELLAKQTKFFKYTLGVTNGTSSLQYAILFKSLLNKTAS